MSELLLPIITLAFAAALQPLQVIALLALLQTGRGIHNGLAYIGGMTSFRLALALVFWWLVSGVETAVESQGGDFGVITGTVMIILGLLLMIFALRQVFSAQSDDQAAALLRFQYLVKHPPKGKHVLQGHDKRKTDCKGHAHSRQACRQRARLGGPQHQ